MVIQCFVVTLYEQVSNKIVKNIIRGKSNLTLILRAYIDDTKTYKKRMCNSEFKTVKIQNLIRFNSNATIFFLLENKILEYNPVLFISKFQLNLPI
jgi:hypothetical protein